MSESGLLESVVIIERDVNGDVLPVWSYPESNAEEEAVIRARSGLLADGTKTHTVFSRVGGAWLYSATVAGANIEFPEELSHVTGICVSLRTKAFHPEKYLKLVKILSAAYMQEGNPVSVLQAFLSVFSTDSFVDEAGNNFSSADFDPRTALLASPLSSIVQLLGLEVILVWTAILLKKRVFVLGENTSQLLSVVRAFPLLVFHRQPWSLLRPFLNLSNEETEELKTAGVFIAGTVDPAIRGRNDLFDVLVDIGEGTVVIAESAKEDMKMTSIHKDVATWLVDAVEQGTADAAVVKGLMQKTKDIVARLRQLTGDSAVTLSQLQEAMPNANAAMKRFLSSLALAEGVIRAESTPAEASA